MGLLMPPPYGVWMSMGFAVVALGLTDFRGPAWRRVSVQAASHSSRHAAAIAPRMNVATVVFIAARLFMALVPGGV